MAPWSPVLSLGNICISPSVFRQLSATCSTSLPSQHLRPPCLFSLRPYSLELFPGFQLGPDHQ